MTQPVLAVGAVVLREDGAVLLVRRGRPPAVGSWTLPGGKVEPGETLAQAVVREVAEETSLVVTPLGVVETVELSREGFSYRIVDFVCATQDRHTPRAGDDVDDARWVLGSNLAALSLTTEVIRVIAQARAVK